MPLNAGMLRHRIRIERRVAGIDAHGQASESWETYADRRAQFLPEKGREYFAAGQVQAENAVLWRIRRDPGAAPMVPTPAMRIIDRGISGLTYRIEAVIHSPNGEWTDIYCSSAVTE